MVAVFVQKVGIPRKLLKFCENLGYVLRQKEKKVVYSGRLIDLELIRL